MRFRWKSLHTGDRTMKYHIVVEKWAAKFIRKQQPAQQKRIMQALAQLPFAGDIKPMAGSEGFYRLRVGDYRILYTVEEEIITVRVTDAGNRGDIYK